MTSNCGLIPR